MLAYTAIAAGILTSSEPSSSKALDAHPADIVVVHSPRLIPILRRRRRLRLILLPRLRAALARVQSGRSSECQEQCNVNDVDIFGWVVAEKARRAGGMLIAWVEGTQSCWSYSACSPRRPALLT